MIYNLYIFNRQGGCLLLQQWNKEHQKRPNYPDEAKALEHEKKNMFGLLFSMKSFVNSITPYKLEPMENEPFYAFSTKEYKLHYFETLSGLRFVLTTDRTAARQTDTLKYIYRLYLEEVVKNPLYKKDSTIDIPSLLSKLDATVRTLPIFSSPAPTE